MKTAASNIYLVAAVGVLAVVISAIWSCYSNEWHWFGRSGSMMTICGVVLGARPLVRMGLARWIEYQSDIDGGHFQPTPEELEADRQSRIDSRASQVRIAFALAGMLIWAYGDLLGAAAVGALQIIQAEPDSRVGLTQASELLGRRHGEAI